MNCTASTSISILAVNAAMVFSQPPGGTAEKWLETTQCLERTFGRTPKSVHNEARRLDLDRVAGAATLLSDLGERQALAQEVDEVAFEPDDGVLERQREEEAEQRDRDRGDGRQRQPGAARRRAGCLEVGQSRHE